MNNFLWEEQKLNEQILILSFLFSKALKSYERNAAPILHLGGLEITTVKVYNMSK